MSNVPDELKGGFRAKDCAMLCQNSDFRLYLDRRRAAKFKLDTPDGTHTDDDARDFILAACAISSRAELDHNDEAATMYRTIKARFQKWLHRRHRQGL
jgi:hypothetical protein